MINETVNQVAAQYAQTAEYNATVAAKKDLYELAERLTK